MSKRDKQLQQHVEALLSDRKPKRSQPSEDLPAMQMAARLRAAHPGSAEPSPQFVDDLARRLRRESDAATVAMPQRRRFLAAAGLAAAAGVGAGFGVEHLREALSESHGSGQPAIVPAEGEWVAVTTLAALSPGLIHRFSANGIEGFLLNVNGELRALSAVCTDQGCLLQANAAARTLVCPCHWATFQLDGRPTPGTPYEHEVTTLPSISVRSNNGNVEVLVPKTL